MKKTIFEEMGGIYIRHGDYLIPCLTLPEEEEQRFIGVWIVEQMKQAQGAGDYRIVKGR